MSESDQINPARLKNWFARCLGIAAQVREARADLAEMKKEDTRRQVDWSRLRALAVAHDADMHDEKKHDRVKTMLGKGTYASWYADIVGIGNSEQIVAPRSSSKKGPSGDAGHASRSAPVAADGDHGDGESAVTTNSDALAINPPAPSHTDSDAAAGVAPSTSAAPESEPVAFQGPIRSGGIDPVGDAGFPAGSPPIRDSDEFNDIRGTAFDRSLWV